MEARGGRARCRVRGGNRLFVSRWWCKRTWDHDAFFIETSYVLHDAGNDDQRLTKRVSFLRNSVNALQLTSVVT